MPAVAPPAGPRRSAPPTAVLVGLALALVWLALAAVRDLTEPDEGRYAEIAREMAHSADWVIPRLNGLVYLEKPPLQYWLTAAWFRLAGVSEFGARLWPVLAGLLTAALAGWAVARRRGPGTGLDTALMLGSAVLFVACGEVLTLDMGLTFFMTAALVAWLRALAAAGEREATPGGSLPAALAFWIALAGGLLSKGLVAVVLPAGAVMLACALLRSLRPLACLRPVAGVPLMLALALPWHLLAQSRQGVFFDFYIVGEHFGRFSRPGHNRPGPWWSIAAAGWAGLLPWAGLLVPALGAGWRRSADAVRARWGGSNGTASPVTPWSDDAAAIVPVLCWMVVIVGFFSLSSSKLPGYVLPALPAAAILMGLTLPFNGRAGRVAVPLALLAMGALLAALGWYGATWDKIGESLTDPAGFRFAFGVGAAVVLAAAAGTWRARDLSMRVVAQTSRQRIVARHATAPPVPR